MRKGTLTKCLTGAVAMALFFALSGFAQENMTRVEDSALKHPMRPLALFAHDAHNEKAGIEECAVCHHVYKNGKKVEGSSSEGVACSECHMGRKGDIMPLVRAYHARCKGCHEEKKVGPVMCAECHQKEKKL